MDIQWWQIILLTLYSGYQIWDELHLITSAGSAVFAGLVTGLIMGDVTTGLIIGGAMQLTILGVGTFGGASRIDANSGTILATAFSIAIGMDPQQAVAALAVPVAALMIQTDVLARFANTFFAHRIDAAIENHNYKAIERNYLLGLLPWTLSRMIPVFLALAFGGGVVQTAVDFLNTNLAWLADGLTLAGRVLPAVGFAILLRYLPVKKHIQYLVLGFVLTSLLAVVFTNVMNLGTAVGGLVEDLSGTFIPLPMLAISLIGFVLAYNHYKDVVAQQAISEKLANRPAPTPTKAGSDTDSQVENQVEGEILDDEL